MSLLETLFGVPEPRLRPLTLERLEYRTPDLDLTLEGVSVYADPNDGDALVKDRRYVDGIWRTIDGAPWEGKTLLADAIRPEEEFAWHYNAPDGGIVAFRFRIEGAHSRDQCRRLLRASIRRAFIERGVRLCRIVAAGRGRLSRGRRARRGGSR